MIDWINKSAKNESAWWNNIWVRTLPQSATVRAEVAHELAPRTAEELREALIAHGLPTSIYGFDKPQLTLDGPPVIEASAVAEPLAEAEPDEH